MTKEYQEAERRLCEQAEPVGDADLRVQVARLEAKNLEMAAALGWIVALIEYREHAFGEPEVDDANYLKSLHDWLPQGHAALSGEGKVWEQAGVRSALQMWDDYFYLSCGDFNAKYPWLLGTRADDLMCAFTHAALAAMRGE